MELFDADAHVNPAPTFWDDYLPRKFAGRGPKWEPGGPDEAHDWLVFEGTRKPMPCPLDLVAEHGQLLSARIEAVMAFLGY